ncbi:hypothetical protein PAXRUDRAFT_791622 [Paxillus rubicundulus Ve08.2h10]|uniref:Uncharacterized protein n=1 Tax=Paxillus rubicundulus Ve08.2h10 TaxID=930991 RepID=A0A0D0DMC1_9AGAM|nr:hypothetical protein PAXRUDRAFT_791622 [Paxillus rubicundulus Ve08.2h10]
MGPLAVFFSEFENFSLDPAAAPTDEFNRLLSTVGNENARVLRDDFREALVDEFVAAYGKSNSLYPWRALCGDIGIDPIPETLGECQIARKSFVNIIDLLQARSTRTKVQRFASIKELAEYTATTKRFFPRDKARGNLLEELLRRILDEAPKKRRRRKKTKVPQDVGNSQQQQGSGLAGKKRKRRNRARRRANLALLTAAATGTASVPPANEVSV